MLPDFSFKKLAVLSLLAGYVTGGFAPAVMAEPHSPQGKQGFAYDHPPHGQFNEDHFIEKLNLTPTQTQKFKEMREASKAKAAPLKQALQAKRAELMHYLFSAQANQTHAMALQQQMGQLQSQLGVLRLQALFQMRGLLTPEQLQQFTQLHQQREAQFKSRPMGGRPPSPDN